MRRLLNRKCLEKLDEWKCDGIQLCEKNKLGSSMGQRRCTPKAKCTAVDGDDHGSVDKDQKQEPKEQ